jgi:hypothetical protein
VTAYEWLQQSGYEDVAALIDKVMLRWKASGARTRRNWWETLAGGQEGKPHTVEGLTFPVLAAAQRHQGLPVTPSAICRNRDESVPRRKFLGRSAQNRRPTSR